MAGVLAFAMLGSGVVIPQAAWADGEDKAAAEVTDAAENAASDTGERDPLANSWRYTNGALNAAESGVFQLQSDGQSFESLATHPNAWQATDNGYLSSDGSIIKGACHKGIDVSEWQHEIDWEAVKEDDVAFAILRCGYGGNFEEQDDKYWERNVAECERLGIPYGVYIYSYADSVERARSEAEHVLRLVKGHHPQMHIWYDLEESSLAKKENRELLAEIAKTFCDMIEGAGYSVGIYANLNWWNNYLTHPIFDRWMRWVAQYNVACRYHGPYKLWQATSSGRVDGISTLIDVNFEFEGHFHDVDYSDWYVSGGHLAYMTSNGFMSGYGTGFNFGPYDNITRGQLACILHNMEGNPTRSSRSFRDVDYNAYYGDAIRWARAVGVINGYGNNMFGPDDPITREDLCCMLANYAMYKGESIAFNPNALNSKPDRASVSDHARASMAWAVDTGLMNGIPEGGQVKLKPQDNTSRASVVTMAATLHQRL